MLHHGLSPRGKGNDLFLIYTSQVKIYPFGQCNTIKGLEINPYNYGYTDFQERNWERSVFSTTIAGRTTCPWAKE